VPRRRRPALSALAIASVCTALLATALLPAAIDQPAFTPWIIARQLRYHSDAGYDVAFMPARGGIDVARQIGNGKAAIGGAPGDTPINVRGAGVRMKAIAVLGGGSLTTIVACRDSGIHTVRDLRGNAPPPASAKPT